MKRGKHLFSISILLIFITGSLLLFPGCGQKAEKVAASVKVYKIGAILPLTGTQSYFGEESKEGIELAEKELKTGLKEKGIELKMIYEDSANDPAQTAVAANKLVNADIKYIISLFPMSPVVNSIVQTRNDVLHLAATMSPDTVIPRKTMRIYPSQSEEARKMIDFMKSIGAKRVAVFHLRIKDHEAVAAQIKAGLEKAGVQLITETMEFTDADAKAQMQKIKNFKPDLLMLILLPDFHYRVFKAINEIGGLPKNTRIIGNISFLYPTKETPREWLENVCFLAPKAFIGGLNLPGKFQEDFKSEFKKDPTIVSTFLYINMKILGKALLNGKTSSQDIIDFLTTTKRFNTVAGEIEILPDGDCTLPLGYGVIKDGKRLAFTLEQPQPKD